MKTSLNPLMYLLSKKFEYLKEEAVEEIIKLKPGHYYVAGRGGGGAGASGAGGVGNFFEKDFTITTTRQVQVKVGAGGLSKQAGGNGGDYTSFYPQYTYTVNPTPSDATVTLSANGIVQPTTLMDLGDLISQYTIEYDGGEDFDNSNYTDLVEFSYHATGNSITVAEGAKVSYVISKTNYVTKRGSEQVYADKTLSGEDATIYLLNRKLIVNATPNDASISFDSGSIPKVVDGNKCTVPHGTTVTYTISRYGYTTKSFTTNVIQDNQTETKEIPKNNYKLTIKTTPDDATVTFDTSSSGGTVDGKSITVPYNTTIKYSVSRYGYQTKSNLQYTVTKTETINALALDKENYTVTFTTDPADATIAFNTTGTVSGKSITVPYETVISYNISRTGYQSKNNQTYTCTKTETVPAPALTKNNYTLTVNTTPADATVNFSTGTVSGHNCTVPYNTTVTYTVSKSGYKTSETYTATVTANSSVSKKIIRNRLNYLTSGQTASVTLDPGTYTLYMRGAGGAGGTNGTMCTNVNLQGSGGAGYSAPLIQTTFTLSQAAVAEIYVGKYALAGGGGAGGKRGEATAATVEEGDGGPGGGAGDPSLLRIKTANYFVVAAGGPGGGGGGGSGSKGRRSKGGGGGGGGQSSYVDSVDVNAHNTLPEYVKYSNGAAGGNGAPYYNYGSAGAAGNDISSWSGVSIIAGTGGGGSTAQGGAGGAGGTGAGAGGGGGNAGDRNNHTHDSSVGGAGGGGAPGFLYYQFGNWYCVAGYGGFGGGSNGATAPTHATNANSTPVSTISENAAIGLNAEYGQGGVVGGNSGSGFVSIIQTS